MPVPYDRDAEDILSLQTELAQAIVREIRLKLAPQDEARIASLIAGSKKVDPQAYDLHLRARKALMDLHVDPSSERWQTAYKYIQQALSLDPAYAPNWVDLASYYCFGHAFGFLAFNDAVVKAEPALEKAFELDPNSPEAHRSAYNSKFNKWDWEGARKEIERFIELAPGDPEAR